MKLKGREIKGPNVEYIIIPRTEGDIVLKARAVLDTKAFDAIFPMPKPPTLTKANGVVESDFKDAAYLGLVKQRNMARYGWIFLTALSATDDLEWDTLNLEKPETWHLWEEELRGSGFSDPEINLIMDGVASANGLNQEKLEEARKRFFAGLTPQIVS